MTPTSLTYPNMAYVSILILPRNWKFLRKAKEEGDVGPLVLASRGRLARNITKEAKERRVELVKNSKISKKKQTLHRTPSVFDYIIIVHIIHTTQWQFTNNSSLIKCLPYISIIDGFRILVLSLFLFKYCYQIKVLKFHDHETFLPSNIPPPSSNLTHPLTHSSL